jgi:hypothetical protein
VQPLRLIVILLGTQVEPVSEKNDRVLNQINSVAMLQSDRMRLFNPL